VKDLLQLLEKYLWREALFSVIPTAKRSERLTPPILVFWFASEWFITALVIWLRKRNGSEALIAATVIFASAFFVISLFFIVEFVRIGIRRY